MAGRLQRIPVGILNYLGLKTTGRNTTLYPDHLQPMFEQREHYLLDLRDVVADPTAQVAPNTTATVSLVVPRATLWRVLGVALAIEWDGAPPASTEVHGRIEYLRTFSAGETCGIAAWHETYGPLPVIQYATMFPQWFLMGPDQRLVMVLDIDPAPAVDWNVRGAAIVETIEV